MMTDILGDGPLGFVALAAISALTGVPPSSGPNLLAGSLFGTPLGTAFYMLGTMLGSTMSYILVRSLLRDFLMRKMATHAAKWQGLDVAIAKEGAFFIVVLLRLSPAMPLAVANAVLGLTSVGIAPFFLGTSLGLLPFSFVYVYVGSLGSQMASSSGDSPAYDPLQLGLTVAGLVATVALTWKISKVATAALEAAQATPAVPAVPATAAVSAPNVAASRPKRRAASPKRLGVYDGFGEGAAGKWASPVPAQRKKA